MITRFNTIVRPATDETDEQEVVRFFEKRSLIGTMPVDEISDTREDWETQLLEFITKDAKGNPLKVGRTVEAAIKFLESDVNDDEEEEREGGSIVPDKYRQQYGTEQNCGDAIAVALTAFVTEPRKSKKNEDGGLDRAKLRAVAEVNGIADKLAIWEDRGLNGGLLRMNTSNVLRGMNRRGEEVTIGSDVWPAREVEKKVRKPRAKKAK